jgi:hypothetical protein
MNKKSLLVVVRSNLETSPETTLAVTRYHALGSARQHRHLICDARALLQIGDRERERERESTNTGGTVFFKNNQLQLRQNNRTTKTNAQIPARSIRA